jgi:hypothetical protein
MSLGWQTESALLPSKAKAINVDSKSLFSLKAVIYETEQRKTSMIKDKPKRSLQRKFSDKANEEEEEPKDPFVNKAEKALEAKSKLYEEILSGRVEGEASLVDFSSKRLKTSGADDFPEETHLYSTVQSAPSPSVVTAEYGKQQWQWSKGKASEKESEEVVAKWRKEEQASRKLQEEVTKRIAAEHGTMNGSSKSNAMESGWEGVSNAARIKTQWEKTLNSSAREYINQVHEETLANRGGGNVERMEDSNILAENGKKNSREERLEMIKRKREAQLSKQQ